MLYFDLLLNLSLLISLSIVSGFIEKRSARDTAWGKILQGLLFGAAAVIGMIRPLVIAPGLIFDGRSIMVSLGALFFGPLTAGIAAAMTITARLLIGGPGVLMGILVILSSAGIGLAARVKFQPSQTPPSGVFLFFFGLTVHIVMVALMFTLPGDLAVAMVVEIGPTILVFYPLAVVLAGKILSDQVAAKNYLELLQERETFYKTIMDHLPVGVAVNTAIPEVRFQYMNEKFPQIYQVSREMLSDVDMFWDTVYEDPEFRRTLRRQVEQDIRSGDPDRMHWEDIPISHKGKITRYVNALNVPLPEKDVMISTVWDVTDWVKLQEQLMQSQKMESVGRLAGGIAHDFNNNLSVIIGYTELVMEQIGNTDPSYETLKEIIHAAHNSTELVQQLLAFARKQTRSPKVLLLNDAAASALKMLDRLIGADVICEFSPGADDLPILMDPTQLEQILTNLCINARDAVIEYKPRGSIVIETARISKDEAACLDHSGCIPGDFALLSVSDDGCGMDGELKSMIFEPFFTTKTLQKGTGLGLPTVYGIVRQNHGFISVYSEPGRGTTFKVYFPLYFGDEQIHREQEADMNTQGDGESILIVDDDQSILQITKSLLESLGYRVITAESAMEAVRSMEAHHQEIQLILTDVVMPEMNGRELAERLHTIKPDVKVLYMSGYTANVIAKKGVLENGVNFIQKPFSKASLASKIAETIAAVQKG